MHAEPSWDAVILHVDMDAFFLKVELLDAPQHIGVPSLVAQDHPRAVVLSASYEARPYGIRSAMPLAHARALCPGVVVLEPQRHKYTAVSETVMDVFHSVTPAVEQLSIDEAFLDVSGSRRRLGSPVRIAQRIKDDIRSRTGLPATVGVAKNKSVAKIVSTRSKPDGMGVVAPGQTRQYLAPLPVSVIWGVGPKLAERLENASIATVGDLAAQDPQRMQRWLGVAGPGLVQLARGIDPREVVPEREAKSHGVEETFSRDITDAAVLHRHLVELSYECARRLRGDEMSAGALSVKVRDDQRAVRTRTQQLPVASASGAVLVEAAEKLLDDLMRQRWHPVRLLGVRGEKLTSTDIAGSAHRAGSVNIVQDALFSTTDDDADGPERIEEWQRTDQVLDDVRRRFPSAAVQPATLLDREAADDRDAEEDP